MSLLGQPKKHQKISAVHKCSATTTTKKTPGESASIIQFKRSLQLSLYTKKKSRNNDAQDFLQMKLDESLPAALNLYHTTVNSKREAL